jgi:hypothetical protein
VDLDFGGDLMHDPLVVAFEIHRPWPRREHSHDSIRPHRPDHVFPRWRFKLHHDCLTCDEQERAEHAGKRFFPWWRPSSWTPFWTVAGRGLYWPSLVTVWHREPGGHDSGEVCRHYVRWLDADGRWQMKVLHGWRFHVHHWKVQVHPLQALRRWALTRCAWCGGKSRRGDYVNVSHQWDGPTGRWWQGAPGLFHHDCSAVESAHRACTCADPITEHDRYGWCARCGKFRAFDRPPLSVAADRILAAIPAGRRPSAAQMAQVEALWKAARRAEKV